MLPPCSVVKGIAWQRLAVKLPCHWLAFEHIDLALLSHRIIALALLSCQEFFDVA